MFLLTKPDRYAVQQFLDDRVNDHYSYPEIGATASDAPSGYNIDRNRLRLGVGIEVFEHGKTAIREWKMFDLGWVELISIDIPIETGQTVAILVSHYGFYSLNAARIVYTINEPNKFGFAYGTLTEHGEIGEERFSVEYNADSDEVWYDIFAFSRPAALLAKIGYPISRSLQKAFAQDSKMAMQRAVSQAKNS
ncbi:MAG: DUF1990 domain-containing protein [Pyrinomonadaceae bacterium]|nr:DUF1990 domain-containing protein [Acidobacteriota bacterium]MBP7377790.1 DUF1990 domain-containing protein [Pyrinomonadaceae bacterium]